MTGGTHKRLGRPPESSSADTRRRLLETAQRHFGRFGYGGATNKDIAADSGVTSASIYYYFPSKQELYAAAVDDNWAVISQHFEEAAARPGTIADRLTAVLDAAVRLNRQFPHLALFSVNVSVEGQRYPELRDIAYRHQERIEAFFGTLVDGGAARGELADDVDPKAVVRLLVALTAGMARYATLASPDGHAEAIAACARLIDGTLFSSV